MADSTSTLVVNVIPDHFNSQISNVTSSIRSANLSARNTVRRPTRGLTINDDTFATLRVVRGDGTSVSLVDAGSRATNNGHPLQIGSKRATDVYSNFLLQSVQEDRQEKAQILETFGEAYIFLFGERARVINFSGILANTQDFNWEAEWWENYDLYLRGTKCVQNNARVFLAYDNTLVSGYILNANATKNASERNWINFSFQLFVTSYSTLTNIGDPRVEGGSPIEIHPEDIAALRPSLITDQDGRELSQIAADDGEVPSLFSSLANQAKATFNLISSAANAIQQVGNMIAKIGNNLLNGTVIRVPIGFEGSTVFDNDQTVSEPVNIQGGVVKFSVYSDNEDEYVGRSSYGAYGDSTIGLGGNGALIRGTNHAAALFGPISAEDIWQQGEDQTVAAAKLWKAQGFSIPVNNFISNLTSTLNVVKNVGLTAYNGIKGANALSSVLNPTATTPGFVNLNQATSIATKGLGGGTITHLPTGTKVV